MLTGEAPLLELTWMGQIIASLIALFAMIIMATVTGIIASGFERAMVENNVAKQVSMETRRALKYHISESLSKERAGSRTGTPVDWLANGLGENYSQHLSLDMQQRRTDLERAMLNFEKRERAD